MSRTINITDINTLKNELRRYKAGKKLDIPQFNQVARLAWLGKVTLQPLDPADPECRSMLVYIEDPEHLPAQILDVDPGLTRQIHLIDGDQAQALAKVVELGVQQRAGLYQELNRRDFYFDHFYSSDNSDSP